MTIRLAQKVLDDVEQWAARQDDTPARSPALARLVEIGLRATPKARPVERALAHAAELAANGADKIAGPPAAPREQAQRRKLTMRHSEARVDRPRTKGK